MQVNDRDMFDKAMIDCYDYHGIPVNEKSMDLYFRLLSQYDLQTVLDGLESVLRTSKFFPKVSEIVEQIEGNEKDLIDAAYQDIKGIIYHGFYGPRRLNNPITMKVIMDMGGQEKFYNQVFVDKADDTAAYFEFSRIYRIYYRMYRVGTFKSDLKYLKGYADQLPGAKPIIFEEIPLVGNGLKNDKLMLGDGK